MRPLRTIVPLLLAAALIGGCGGGSDENAAFNKDYESINDELINLQGSISQAPQGSDAMLAGEFSGFATQVDRLVARLDGLKPRGDLRAPADGVSARLVLLEADLKQIAASARVHDAQATREATEKMVIDLKAAEQARRTLAKRTGARVGP
jgi:hypothetical protein